MGMKALPAGGGSSANAVSLRRVRLAAIGAVAVALAALAWLLIGNQTQPV